MGEIILGEEQEKAIIEAVRWFKKDTKDQTFILAGGPGTGKTFLVSHIMDELGLAMHNVKFCAFTGRASLILREKGLPANTIHNTIYYTKVETKYERDERTGKLKAKRKMETKRRESLGDQVKLIVVDEISMVSQEMLDDLLSYGVKLLGLGDQDQLPAVNAPSNNLLENPDAVLTKNYRQGEGSVIIDLANDIRDGNPIRYGRYSDQVIVAPKHLMRIEHLMEVDQVICPTNALRDDINIQARQYLKHNSEFPVEDEKLINTQNEWGTLTYSPRFDDDMPLINGLIGYAKDVEEYDAFTRRIPMSFIPTFDDKAIWEDLNIDTQLFKTYPNIRPRTEKDDTSFFEYGYAITVHKAQGSEFNTVAMVLADYIPYGDMGRKLLFTGVTRARKKLLVYM